MDRVAISTKFEMEVEKVMRKYGVDRAEAGIIVGNLHGDLTNDIVFDPPLTEAQRERMGLGKTLREVMSELGELDDER